MKTLITRLLLLLPFFAHAQDYVTITGKLTSQTNDEPVVYAHIYIPNTTFGTYSEDDGTFELRARVWNKFELTISHIEHEITSLQINAESEKIDIGTIRLAMNAYELNEVVVNENKDWKKHFDLFQRHFIGTTPNARQCKIKNKLVLNFDYNEQTGVLQAWAYEPLRVENKALGYEITYDLVLFELNTYKGLVLYKGFSFFEPMEGKRKRQSRRWNKARDEAYRGSLMHFTRSLYRNELEQEGFDLKILAKIRHGNEGSAIRISGVTPLPIAREEIISQDETPDALVFKAPEKLQVLYLKEKESNAYVAEMRSLFRPDREKADFQTSGIKILTDFVHIYKDGYINDGTDMIVDGYFGWEKIGDLLPLDFDPE